MTTGAVMLVQEPAEVQVDQDRDGLLSVVRVQTCCALAAATRALMAAILLCILSWAFELVRSFVNDVKASLDRKGLLASEEKTKRL